MVSYAELLRRFWEAHDPTQGMRQGNDVGTQYRSGIYVFDDEQRRQAEASRDDYQDALGKARGAITTEILGAGILLRRGLSPAIPRQEPRRLLRARRHRRHLPDLRGSGGLAASLIASGRAGAAGARVFDLGGCGRPTAGGDRGRR